MTEFSVNTQHRRNPYGNWKYQLYMDDHYVAGLSKISGGLTRNTEVIEHRSGGDPSTVVKSPGQTKYEPITLERGVTHDEDFEAWANKVWTLGAGLGAEVSLKDFRKDIRLDFLNEAGQVALSYNIFDCWVSEYQALPELDASASAVAIQHIKVEHSGFERDLAVAEPEEPTF